MNGRVYLYACIEGAPFGLTPVQVLGHRRTAAHVAARKGLWRRLADDGLSSVQIGRWTGRDHTTILHALGRRTGRGNR